MFIPLKDENPTRRFPVVTVLIIAVNAVVFLFQMLSSTGFDLTILKYGAVPYEITHFVSLSAPGVDRLSPPLTLVTAMFLHGSLFHLLGNMLYLWIFGNNIEDVLGSLRFTVFYLISGLGATLVHIIFHAGSRVPMIGASGAIAGILGAYLILFPAARVLTLVFIWVIPVPAAILLMLWFLGQIMNIGIGGGVAWFAHVGGFLIGVLLIRKTVRPRPPRIYVN